MGRAKNALHFQGVAAATPGDHNVLVRSGVVWEIHMLRSTWRGLETESRFGLHGRERGNLGHRQGQNLTDHRASPRPYLSEGGVNGPLSNGTPGRRVGRHMEVDDQSVLAFVDFYCFSYNEH